MDKFKSIYKPILKTIRPGEQRQVVREQSTNVKVPLEIASERSSKEPPKPFEFKPRNVPLMDLNRSDLLPSAPLSSTKEEHNQEEVSDVKIDKDEMSNELEEFMVSDDDVDFSLKEPNKELDHSKEQLVHTKEEQVHNEEIKVTFQHEAEISDCIDASMIFIMFFILLIFLFIVDYLNSRQFLLDMEKDLDIFNQEVPSLLQAFDEKLVILNELTKSWEELLK